VGQNDEKWPGLLRTYIVGSIGDGLGDVIGGLGPDERLRVLVPLIEPFSSSDFGV
jgi:hypothetical protein